MKTQTPTKPKAAVCRPTHLARKRIDYAKSIGMNESCFLNELVETYGRQYLEKVKRTKIEKIKETLDALVP